MTTATATSPIDTFVTVIIDGAHVDGANADTINTNADRDPASARIIHELDGYLDDLDVAQTIADSDPDILDVRCVSMYDGQGGAFHGYALIRRSHLVTAGMTVPEGREGRRVAATVMSDELDRLANWYRFGIR